MGHLGELTSLSKNKNTFKDRDILLEVQKNYIDFDKKDEEGKVDTFRKL